MAELAFVRCYVGCPDGPLLTFFIVLKNVGGVRFDRLLGSKFSNTIIYDYFMVKKKKNNFYSFKKRIFDRFDLFDCDLVIKTYFITS